MIGFFKNIYLSIYVRLFPIKRLAKSGAKIGKNVFIGKDVYFELENAKLITIEDGVVLSAFTKLIPHDSSLNNVSGFDVMYGEIILKKNCYIGANTVVLPGSTVGENTIVGANSLVKGSLKKNSVYIGSPAKYYCSTAEMKSKWLKIKNDKKEKRIFFKTQAKWHEENKSRMWSGL